MFRYIERGVSKRTYITKITLHFYSTVAMATRGWL